MIRAYTRINNCRSDVFGIASGPAKADAELIVHPQAPLAGTIALQLLETARRRRAQIVDAACEVELLQLAQRWTLDVGQACHALQPEQRPGIDTLDRPDRHCDNSNAIRD